MTLKIKTDPTDTVVTEILDDGEVPVFMVEEDIEASEYSIGYNIADGEAVLKFSNEFGALSTFTIDSTGLYDLAHRLLRAYDKLEGL